MDYHTVSKLIRAGIDPLEAVEILEASGGEEKTIVKLLQEKDPVAAAKFMSLLGINIKGKNGIKALYRKEITELLRKMDVTGLTSEEIVKEIENIIRLDASLLREDTVRCLAFAEALRRRLHPKEIIYCLTGEELKRGDLTLVSISFLGDELLKGLTEGYVKLHGLKNPFIPYAEAYISKTVHPKKWFKGLFEYLRTPFLDKPSIYLPPYVDNEIKDALEGVLLWSPEGPIVSDIPVYSFGRIPEKRVLDVVEIDVKMLDVKREKGIKETLEELRLELEAYFDKKKRILGDGAAVIIINDYEEIFEGFRVLGR